MNDKAIRFLNQIGIDDIDLFDFDVVGVKKLDKPNEWKVGLSCNSKREDISALHFLIEKVSEFSQYKYTLTFIYKDKITLDDILSFFIEFFKDKTGRDVSRLLNIYGDTIVYKNDKEIIDSLNEFYELIDFICYPKVYFSCDVNDTTILKPEENVDDFFEEDSTETSESLDFDFSEEELEQIDIEAEKQSLVSQASEKMIQNMNLRQERLEGLDKNRNYRDLTLKQLVNINEEHMDVLSDGIIFSVENKEARFGKIKSTIGVHNGLDCIYVVANEGKYFSKEFLQNLEKDQQENPELFDRIRIKFTGYTTRDKFLNNIVVSATSISRLDPVPLRTDESEEKRVELHLHTKMSNMDGVGSITDYCRVAHNMGHKAIAITDHGVVQGFPEAQKAAKDFKLKMIYGSELYVVDDEFRGAYNPRNEDLEDATYVVFDLETTGLSSRYDRIIEFGAVKFKHGSIDSLNILINPEMKLSESTKEITHITDEELANKPKIEEVIDEIMNFIGDSILVSHNLEFDYGFLNETLIRLGKGPLKSPGIDTLALSRFLNPDVDRHNLEALCKRCEVYYDKKSAHRAVYDADVLANSWGVLMYKLFDKGYKNLNQIEFLPKEEAHIKHSYVYHAVVLAKNADGLKDLYKLISLSHIEYLGKVPCVPRSKLIKYRTNLILGSACFNGEVFDAAATLSEEQLDETISFYDYIEIQPKDNYRFLIETREKSIEDYQRLDIVLKSIVDSAEKQNKMICVTGDCHYVDPEDKIFRDVYVYNAGVGKTAHALYTLKRKHQEEKGIYFENPDQYYKSTQELLDEFKFVGEEKAREWIITNPNKIADQCEELFPVKSKLYPPTMEGSDIELRKLIYDTAHELYGDPLPEIIENRLEREVGGIFGAGYYVTYYIAYRIIKRANDEGYIIGSRGSVGSSFAATMAHITEVNPLPPHYRCPKCKHFELYEGNEFFSGYDLPEKKCPVCGETMISDGQNIPFETFLGFNADKVPDIDLNFPPDFQGEAHLYTKELFGADNVLRAGTIGTVAEKTAIGHARGYYETKYKMADTTSIPRARIGFLASGCKDVKRTTGQHPGGIIVIPKEYEVYDFTAVQYPADDLDATWKTSHFDFHAIHDTVLKLDLLGHVDPQAVKFMCDRVNMHYLDIPVNDKEVFKLFSSTEPLHLQHNYLKLSNGALALPEFGTEFVRGLLDETKPKSFADLLRISGLSHGTNVWRNNQDLLIKNGVTDLRGIIGCRDNIMEFLISKGVDPSFSFKMMEKVRKGKGVTPEEEAILLDHGVPQYYVDACKKIAYLFPKAHAAAYVTMAIRVAWFKVHNPLLFYASFFSVRCDKYEWTTMKKGPQAILDRLAELADLKKNHPSDYSKKYEEIEKTLVVSLEFYDRGMKFSDIDIYKSDDNNFIVDEENNALIPPFKVIDGLGGAAAASIKEGRKDGEFLSVEDFEHRTKVNQSLIQVLKEEGALSGLSEHNVEMMSLFDFI